MECIKVQKTDLQNYPTSANIETVSFAKCCFFVLFPLVQFYNLWTTMLVLKAENLYSFTAFAPNLTAGQVFTRLIPTFFNPMIYSHIFQSHISPPLHFWLLTFPVAPFGTRLTMVLSNWPLTGHQQLPSHDLAVAAVKLHHRLCHQHLRCNCHQHSTHGRQYASGWAHLVMSSSHACMFPTAPENFAAKNENHTMRRYQTLIIYLKQFQFYARRLHSILIFSSTNKLKFISQRL